MGRALNEFIRAAAADPSVLDKPFIPRMDPDISTASHQLLVLSCLTGMDHAAETHSLADFQYLPDPVPFDEAIAYMASKVPLTKREYYALDQRLRFRAFTVSRLTQLDAVEKVRRQLVKTIAEGRSLIEFQTQEGLDEALKVAGFDSASPWYWETVYRTNSQTAYNTGRLMQYEKNPPLFLEFIGIEDGRQTEICKARAGTILPYRDPWWERNYPPLHFNCRSTVRAIYKEEAEVRGLTAGKKPKVAEKPASGFGRNPVKSGQYYELTAAMKKRAAEYGIDTEFLTAAVDANLLDYAKGLIKEGVTPDRIVFSGIADTRLRKLAEDAMNPAIPIRSDAAALVEKYKDRVNFRLTMADDWFDYAKEEIAISRISLGEPEKRRLSTLRHEFGHALDHRVTEAMGLSASPEFTGTVRKISEELMGVNMNGALRQDVIDFVTKHYDDPSVSDLFCSITACQDSALHGKYIHRPAYYRNISRQAVECFADLFDLYCINDERWAFIEKTLPELAEGFKKILTKI